MNMNNKGYTAEQIDSLKSERGGWTKESLAKLGISWPPRKGWRKRLIAASKIPDEQNVPQKSTILPCPFCGNVKPLTLKGDSQEIEFIICHDCCVHARLNIWQKRANIP